RQGDAGIAVGAGGQQLDRLGRDLGGIGDPTLGSGQRPPQKLLEVVWIERPQLVDGAAGQQRRIHLEIRVFSGGADQRQQPFLHGRQQGVLLRLVEAVDLVEEEDRRLT